MTKDFVCIACPESCRLRVNGGGGCVSVEGNRCKRGYEHGVSEYARPMRMLTSTVAVSGGILRRLPVIADGGIPKDKIWECLNVLYKIRVKAPVTIGGVIVENILNTGVNIVASRSMNAVKI